MDTGTWRCDFETGNVSYTRFTASPYDGHEGDWESMSVSGVPEHYTNSTNCGIVHDADLESDHGLYWW
jgi:hypothetical protein